MIAGSMSLGDFTAFNSYLAILIFPIILIGFMSNVIAQSSASYMRISAVLGSPEAEKGGQLVADLRGDVGMEHVSLSFGQKMVLEDVSVQCGAGTKTAIIGPTAAGKTQLLYLLIGLLKPTSGTITYDGRADRRVRQGSLTSARGLCVPGQFDLQFDAAGEYRV